MIKDTLLDQLQSKYESAQRGLKEAKGSLRLTQRNLIKTQVNLDRARHNQTIARDINDDTRRHYRNVKRINDKSLEARVKGGRTKSIKAIRSAQRAYNVSQKALQYAQAELRDAGHIHEAARIDYQKTWFAYNDYRRSTARLQKLIDDRIQTIHRLAEQAGVPAAYHNAMVVDIDDAANTNFYFGGIDDPIGPKHGHYVLNAAGYITYMREPHQPKGPHNFQYKKINGQLKGLATCSSNNSKDYPHHTSDGSRVCA